MSKKIFTFKDAIYWHDFEDEEQIVLDFSNQVGQPCIKNNIVLEKYRFFDLPDCLEKHFDILFFDWGGMSLGNSMLEHFCHYIIEHANDHGSRYYVMVSCFTTAAMKDALNSFGKDKPINVFLTIEDLRIYLEKYLI